MSPFLIETHLTPKTTPNFHLTPNNIRTVLMQVIVTILFELFKKFVLLNFDEEFGLPLKVKWHVFHDFKIEKTIDP